MAASLPSAESNNSTTAFDVLQAAKRLSVSETMMRELISKKKIRHVRAGSKILVPASALAEFLAGSTLTA